MTGDDDAVCKEVMATIAFMVFRETKEDTFSRTGGKFMWHCGGKVRITTTAKNSEMIICGWCAKKGLVGGTVLKGFGGVKIKKMSGSAKEFSPICRWHGCLE
jgi:hypothetical protein